MNECERIKAFKDNELNEALYNSEKKEVEISNEGKFVNLKDVDIIIATSCIQSGQSLGTSDIFTRFVVSFAHLRIKKKILAKWLNWHDDFNYEVLPTRKEVKYIVKKRKKKVDETDDKETEEKEDGDKAEEPVEEEEFDV